MVAGCLTRTASSVFSQPTGTTAAGSGPAKGAMVNVLGKQYRHPGCITRASYGAAGSKKVEFCCKHAEESMTNVVNKKCCHPGCITRATYGIAGSKKAEFCCKHAHGDMIGVLNPKSCPKCRHPGCATMPSLGTMPSFGMACSKKAEFCSRHAEESMVSVVGAICRVTKGAPHGRVMAWRVARRRCSAASTQRGA